MINKLEDVCVKLELAKKLKEAGYPQESLFYWVDTDDDGDITLHLEDEWSTVSGEWGDGSSLKEHQHFSAPTASELAENIGEHILWFRAMGRTLKNGWYIVVDSIEETQVYGDSLADVLANLWLWLKEEKL